MPSFEQAYDETVSGSRSDPLAVQAFLAEEQMLREMVEAKFMQPHDPAITPNTNKRSRP